MDPFSRLADGVTFALLRLPPDTHLAEAVHFFVEDTTKILVLLFGMMLVVGFFRSWLAPEKVRAFITGRGAPVAYILAVLLGAVTPFCSCSSISLFIAFVRAGVPLGVTMAFLITSPMVNEVAAVLFAEALGPTFMLIYVGTGMAVGLIGGVLMGRLAPERWVEPLADPKACCATKGREGGPMTLADRARYAWEEAEDVFRRVWLYVVIGVGVGAALHGFVPQDWFLEHAGADNPLAVPLAVVMGIPLYANATGIVPVAEVLIEKGLPVGTTLAFIMSTVAISLPEMMMLRRVLKWPMLALFTAYLAAAFTLVGYGFNWLFS